MEMLVVLVLVGLILSVAMPSIQSLSKSYQKQILLEAILAEIQSLRSLANETGKGYWLPSPDLADSDNGQTNLFQSFGYESIEEIESTGVSSKIAPIVIYPSGYCSGGVLSYSNLSSGLVGEVVLMAPYCDRR